MQLTHELTESEKKDRQLADRPWFLRMQWNDLCFLHWPVDAASLRELIPRGLPLDTYEGEAWLGITPFWMSQVRPRLIPPIPGLSTFPELNVRTYVTLNDSPGVWFFSLDAASALAVTGARALFHLPYFHARMSITRDGAGFRYSSVRNGSPMAQLEARYWPTSAVFRAPPGSLEYWLTERYCLYTSDRNGQIYRSDINHVPWPLQPASAEVAVNTMASAHGLTLPPGPPLAHYAKTLDVRAWYLVRV